MIYLNYDKLVKRHHQPFIRLSVGDTQNTLSMENFAWHYRKLGGKQIPNEIVNMIIRDTQTKISAQNTLVTTIEVYLQIARIIHATSGIRGKELWRLTDTFCQHEYQIQMSYLHYLWHRVFH